MKKLIVSTVIAAISLYSGHIFAAEVVKSIMTCNVVEGPEKCKTVRTWSFNNFSTPTTSCDNDEAYALQLVSFYNDGSASVKQVGSYEKYQDCIDASNK